MESLYRKYRESGLTRGEIIARKRPAKAARSQYSAAELAGICERLDRMRGVDLSPTEKEGLRRELEKLRSIASQKLKLLKE